MNIHEKMQILASLGYGKKKARPVYAITKIDCHLIGLKVLEYVQLGYKTRFQQNHVIRKEHSKVAYNTSTQLSFQNLALL